MKKGILVIAVALLIAGGISLFSVALIAEMPVAYFRGTAVGENGRYTGEVTATNTSSQEEYVGSSNEGEYIVIVVWGEPAYYDISAGDGICTEYNKYHPGTNTNVTVNLSAPPPEAQCPEAP